MDFEHIRERIKDSLKRNEGESHYKRQMTKKFWQGFRSALLETGQIRRAESVALRNLIDCYDYRTYDMQAAVTSALSVDGDLVEAGVYKGATAKIICEVKGDRPLHLFDTFSGLPESMFEDVDFSTDAGKQQLAPGKYSASLGEVKTNLSQYGNVFYYPGIFPETAGVLDGGVFSFVHLDLDLYKSTAEALKFFYPRMSVGGIIISHNYTNLPGVRRAFDEFFKDRSESVRVLSSTQCMVTKLRHNP